MSTLRISDAPLLPDVDGTEKIPTGGRGDYAISIDQIKGHIFQDIGKELVGLGNVDNTSDLDKPVSTAQQAALNLKADKTYVDTDLDLKADKTNVYTRSETSLALSKKADLVNGVVPENQIPSSFNDVLEFTTSTLPFVGESGKIYVTTDTNRTWRWSGNQYVEISNGGVSDSTLKLQTPRKIANVDFDGTQNIDIPHNNLKDRDSAGAHSASAISYKSPISEAINRTLLEKLFYDNLHVRDFGCVGNANFFNELDNKWYVDSLFVELSTDDTDNIKKAINYCVVNNRELCWSGGNYLFDVTSPFYINRPNNKILWNGAGGKIVCASPVSGNFAVTSIDHISVSYLDFSGIKKAQGAASQFNYGLIVYDCNSATIHDNSFVGFIGDGFTIHGATTTDIQKNPTSVHVYANKFDYTGRGGLTVTGSIGGMCYGNTFGKNRVDLSTKTSGDGFVGQCLHIEADPSGRYGIEGFATFSNVIYGSVNVSCPVQEAGYIGDKNTRLKFYNNIVYHELTTVDDNTCYLWGGGHEFYGNEVHVTVASDLTQNLGNGVMKLACQYAHVHHNVFTVNGRRVMYVHQNWAHNDNGRHRIEHNEYITTGVDYQHRYYNSRTTLSKIKSVVIANEDYTKANTVSQFFWGDGYPLYLKFKGLVPKATTLLTASGATNDINVLIDDVNSSAAITLPEAATVCNIYYRNSVVNGVWNRYDIALPLQANIGNYIGSAGVSETKLESDNLFGKPTFFEKESTGVYKLRGLTASQLENRYSFNYSLLQNANDGNLYAYKLKANADGYNRLEIYVDSVLTDPPTFTKFNAFINMRINSIVSQLLAI